MTNKHLWETFWSELTPESEILMRDFYGGRQWILKHTPRFGKSVEAGCGMGRYVFYLKKLGIDVDGVDFSRRTVENAAGWARRNGLSGKLMVGDVTSLPYKTGSLSGYLSFGVVEHFIEGPLLALREAHRILRPGGIAIITVPSMSFSQALHRLRRTAGNLLKPLLGRRVAKKEFSQFWYSRRQLLSFIKEAGLRVVLSGGGDLLYCMWELGARPKNNIFFRLLGRAENTCLSGLGAQSFTVSVKEAPVMFCFLCGAQTVPRERLSRYYLPVCVRCEKTGLAEHYRPGARPRFHRGWEFRPDIPSVRQRSCGYCGKAYQTDRLFEDFGFSEAVCQECLSQPKVNIELSNCFLKPVWRMREGERSLAQT